MVDWLSVTLLISHEFLPGLWKLGSRKLAPMQNSKLSLATDSRHIINLIKINHMRRN
jgi:hypothetical protein